MKRKKDIQMEKKKIEKEKVEAEKEKIEKEKVGVEKKKTEAEKAGVKEKKIEEKKIEEEKSKAQPKAAIIVLNWNGWQDTIECLESLLRLTYPNYQIIVVDNGSTDDSVERIKSWAEGREEPTTPKPSHFLYHLSQPPFPKPIPYFCWTEKEAESDDNSQIHSSLRDPLILIRINTNLGFSAGNNVGIRYALKKKFPYLLVLNNDTAVKPDFLDKLIDFAEENPDSGLIGPKVIDYSDGLNGQWPVKNPLTFAAVLITLTPLGKLLYISGLLCHKNYFYSGNMPQKVYAVPGSCLLFKSEALERVGLFDEKVFLFREEFIMAEKLRKHNLKTYIQPDSVIYHKVGKSTKRLKALKYIAYIESDKYFFSNYFLLTKSQRLIMKTLRVAIYIAQSLISIDYLRNFKKFVKAIKDY